jgi:hypothetical protein
MKPWKLCVNKPNSYKVDVRDLLNSYNMKPYIIIGKNINLYDMRPYIHIGKHNYIDNPNYNINYDFINNKETNIKFECRRFLNKNNKDNKDDSPIIDI